MTDLKRRLGKLELVIRPARGPTALQVDGAAREFDARMTKLSDVIRTEIIGHGPAAVIRRVIDQGSAAEQLALLDALRIPDEVLVESHISVTESQFAAFFAGLKRICGSRDEAAKDGDTNSPSQVDALSCTSLASSGQSMDTPIWQITNNCDKTVYAKGCFGSSCDAGPVKVGGHLSLFDIKKSNLRPNIIRVCWFKDWLNNRCHF